MNRNTDDILRFLIWLTLIGLGVAVALYWIWS